MQQTGFKVVRIITRMNVGGPARHVLWLSDGLARLGWQTKLLYGNVPENEDMLYDGSFPELEQTEYIRLTGLQREISPLLDIIALFKVMNIIIKESPHVVHTHTSKAGWVGRFALFLLRPYWWFSRRKRPMVIHTFHGHTFHGYFSSLKTSMVIALERLLALFCTDIIITISREQRKEIHDVFGVGSDKQLRIIPLGIDLSDFDISKREPGILRKELGINSSSIVFGMVGRLAPIKNHYLLIKAAGKLVNQGINNICFVIAGGGSSKYKNELESYAKLLGASNNVLFIGNRADILSVYRDLDAVVLTSDNEGTPLSIIEALSIGISFVATDVGGVRDLAGDIESKHGKLRICSHGIIVPPRDTDALVEGIRVMASDYNLRKKIGKEGHAFVRTRFSKERLIDDIDQLYREMIGSK